MKRWDRLAYRPGNSETPPIRSADLARDQEERRLLLFVRDLNMVELLRRTLLRKNIWCAPCPRRSDLMSMLRAIEFSSVVLDLDDEVLDGLEALPAIRAYDPGLTRIGLTRSLRLRGEVEGLVEHVLLQPLDIGELLRALRI